MQINYAYHKKCTFFIGTRGLFFLKILEQIKNNAGLGINKLIKNTGQILKLRITFC